MNKLSWYQLSLILLTCVSSCHHKKEMSFEELKKAEWTKLSSGIEYISIDEGKTTDSIRFEIMPVASVGSMITGEPGYNGIVHEEKLLSLLNKQIPTSQNGYLRIEPFISCIPILQWCLFISMI